MRTSLPMIRRNIEELERRGVELDLHLGEPLLHALAVTKQERDAAPTPVVDVGAQRDVGLGARVGRDARLVGDELVIAGSFLSIGGRPRTALASLDTATGDLTSFVDLAFAGVHSGGITLASKIDTTPDGQKLLVIGNFTSVEARWRAKQMPVTPLTAYWCPLRID